jgi:hypothetical protein
LEGCVRDIGYVVRFRYDHRELALSKERGRWIVDNTRYDPNHCKGSRVEFAFEHLLEEIEKALVAERQDVIDFFKDNCCCMAMHKHIEKLNERLPKA